VFKILRKDLLKKKKLLLEKTINGLVTSKYQLKFNVFSLNITDNKIFSKNILTSEEIIKNASIYLELDTRKIHIISQ